jgi:hypothetical protein
VGLLVYSVGLLVYSVGLLIYSVGLLVVYSVGLLVFTVGLLVYSAGLLVDSVGLLVYSVGLLVYNVGLLVYSMCLLPEVDSDRRESLGYDRLAFYQPAHHRPSNKTYIYVQYCTSYTNRQTGLTICIYCTILINVPKFSIFSHITMSIWQICRIPTWYISLELIGNLRQFTFNTTPCQVDFLKLQIVHTFLDRDENPKTKF